MNNFNQMSSQRRWSNFPDRGGREPRWAVLTGCGVLGFFFAFILFLGVKP